MTPTRADLERLLGRKRHLSTLPGSGGVAEFSTQQIDNIIAALLTSEGPAPTCAWKADKHDDTWHTDCGQMWEFNDGGPTENKQRFCGYCGGTLVEVPFVYTDDESEPAEGPETPADTPEGR